MRSVSIVLICILCAGSLELRANDLDIAKLQTDIQSTIESTTPAVVSIGIRGSGFSGVIVSPEGHVLSAGHAVRPGKIYRIVLPDGRRFAARGMGSNKQLDCALIKIDEPKNLPWVPMGNSSQLVADQPCLSLRYPVGARGLSVFRIKKGCLSEKSGYRSLKLLISEKRKNVNFFWQVKT